MAFADFRCACIDALRLGLPLWLLVWAPLRGTAQGVPAYPGARESALYHVWADAAPVFTHAFADAHYAHFVTDAPATITVRANALIQSHSVHPKSAKVEASVTDRDLTLRMSPGQKLVVSIDGGPRLFLFADRPEPDAPQPGRRGVTSVLEFGVDRAGESLQTQRLQQAIDAVAQRGGTLYFPAGVYLTGTLQLKSNLTLYLAGGALLQGSSRAEDYPLDPGRTEAGTRGATMTYSRLLLIDGATNVRIRGFGTIDGAGKTVRSQKRPANLIRVRNSRDVHLENVVLRNAAAWNTHLLYSENITVRGVKLINDRGVRNSDGIDPDSSRDVVIEDCFLYTGDDSFAIKSSGNSGLVRDVERIAVRRCIMLTKKSAMKLGTETFAAFQRDVVFEDNDVIEADRAMALYCSDGATFENVRYSNNRVETTYPDRKRCLFEFTVIQRGKTEPGRIRNVLIANTDVLEPPPRTSLMAGLSANHDIRDIRFVNLRTGGRLVRSAAEAAISMNEFVHDVHVDAR